MQDNKNAKGFLKSKRDDFDWAEEWLERRVHLDKEAVAMEVNRVTLKNLWYLAKQAYERHPERLNLINDFFFDAPPPIMTAEGKPRSKRDLLITQHLQLLNAAFCAFYTTHAPDNIANVEELVARVVGGPPTSVSGVSVGGSLWTEEELCAKLEAKYGAKLVL